MIRCIVIRGEIGNRCASRTRGKVARADRREAAKTDRHRSLRATVNPSDPHFVDADAASTCHIPPPVLHAADPFRPVILHHRGNSGRISCFL